MPVLYNIDKFLEQMCSEFVHIYKTKKTVLTKRKRYAKINKLSQRAVTKKNRADRRKKRESLKNFGKRA